MNCPVCGDPVEITVHNKKYCNVICRVANKAPKKKKPSRPYRYYSAQDRRVVMENPHLSMIELAILIGTDKQRVNALKRRLTKQNI